MSSLRNCVSKQTISSKQIWSKTIWRKTRRLRRFELLKSLLLWSYNMKSKFKIDAGRDIRLLVETNTEKCHYESLINVWCAWDVVWWLPLALLLIRMHSKALFYHKLCSFTSCSFNISYIIYPKATAIYLNLYSPELRAYELYYSTAKIFYHYCIRSSFSKRANESNIV